MKDSALHDAKFVIGINREEFTANASFLSCRSPVFKALFFGGMSESFDKTVVIKEISGESFQAFLKVIYTGTVEVCANNVVELLYLARMYQIKECEFTCEKFLTRYTNTRTVIQVLNALIALGMYDKIEKGLKIVSDNTKEVLNPISTNESTNIVQHYPSRETLIEILKLDTLNMSEAELLNYLIKWSVETKQDIDSSILEHIRFPTMTPRELATIVKPLNILSMEELLEAYEFQALGSSYNTGNKKKFKKRLAPIPKRKLYQMQKANTERRFPSLHR